MAVATAYEIIGAQAFLAALGADESDNMLIAVVSWFRQESGSLDRVIGNNPFNIRPGALSYLAIGTWQGRVGTFLSFPDIGTGFKAAALLLKGFGTAYGYGAVVKAAQSGNAVNFLAAIAMSSWDVAHYGVHDITALGVRITSNAYTLQNHLLDVYSTFTGYQPPTAAQIAFATPKGKGSSAKGGVSKGSAAPGAVAPGVTAATPGLAAAPALAGPFASPQAAPNLAGVEAYTTSWFDARETAKRYAERHHRSTSAR